MSTLRPGPARPVARVWDVGRVAGAVGASSVLVLAAVVVVGIAVPGAGTAGPGLLVVAGLLGLPHGAVDHLPMGWARPGGVRRVLVVGYAALAVGVAWVAVLRPVPTVLVLLVLSCAHFAEGELAFGRLRGRPTSALTAAALGTAVVTLPLLLRPDAVAVVLDGLDPGLAPALDQLRVTVLALTGLLVIAGAVSALRRRAWWPLGELGLVVLASLLAPPLLVFAAWFGAWHAPRHLVRLLELQVSGTTRQRVLALARAAVLPTGAALAGLGVLVVVSGSVPTAVLVVLLALTVPHAAVVARMSAPGGAARAASGRP